MPRTAVACLAAALSISIAPAAHAQTDPIELARTLNAEGDAAYDKGDYDKAVAAYWLAYDKTKIPAFLYNIAQAHRLAEHCKEALHYYKEFLPHATERKQRVEELIDEMAECVSRENKPVVVVQPSRDEVRRRALETADVAGHQWRLSGYIVGGVGVAALAAGSVFAVLSAKSSNDRLTEFANTGGGQWDEGLSTEQDDGRGRDALAAGFLAVGALTTVTGAALYFVGFRKRQQARARVEPIATPSSVGVSVSWEF